MDSEMSLLRPFILLTVLTAACQPPVAAKGAEGLPTAEPAERSTGEQSEQFTPEPTGDPYVKARNEMVDSGVIAWGVTAPRVIEAMRIVPRHLFVPAQYQAEAYDNHPLPIGHGQTISQPYIVALMTQELSIEPGDRVLEIGTGSGYQAAVLAELDMRVFSIEIIGELFEVVGQRLEKAGYSEVQLRHADGYFGWEQAAPFDAIIVTAAPDHVPQPLLQQLKLGGVLVIPVGPVGGFQELWRVERTEADSYESMSLGGVRFVPLVRD